MYRFLCTAPTRALGSQYQDQGGGARRGNLLARQAGQGGTQWLVVWTRRQAPTGTEPGAERQERCAMPSRVRAMGQRSEHLDRAGPGCGAGHLRRASPSLASRRLMTVLKSIIRESFRRSSFGLHRNLYCTHPNHLTVRSSSNIPIQRPLSERHPSDTLSLARACLHRLLTARPPGFFSVRHPPTRGQLCQRRPLGQ